MKSTDHLYFSNENYEFKPFNDDELALIMGGGDGELPFEFLSPDPLVTDQEPAS
jgi:hypothetical protein